ncbi:MAG: hypothetical protein KF862_18315 [Chitinophagaceae bacterium]|nr:hypothetical protein [Chitinophagaceae bacterium]
MQGAALSKLESFTASQIGKFISTEAGAQSTELFKNLIKSGDKFLWSERIDAVIYGGQTYILNGHNRLSALSELGEGSASIYMMSIEDATKEYGQKMKDIAEGAFTQTIKE